MPAYLLAPNQPISIGWPFSLVIQVSARYSASVINSLLTKIKSRPNVLPKLMPAIRVLCAEESLTVLATCSTEAVPYYANK